MKKVVIITLLLLSAVQACAQGIRRHQKEARIFRPHTLKIILLMQRQKWQRPVKLPSAAFGFAAYPGLFCYSGTFYRACGSAFMPVAAPVGVFIPAHVMPGRKIFHRGQWYSVCAGNFFREVPGGFVSEAIPKGICLRELPEDELEQVDGKEGLYLFHDQFWKRRQLNGQILYEALGQVPG